MRPMAPSGSFEIRIRDSALDPAAERRTVRQRLAKAAPLFRVRLFLDGPSLAFVRAATYHLHETFPDPVRRVVRTARNQTCQLEIWTWGVFDVRVEIEDKSGRIHIRTHALTYGAELESGVDRVITE